MIRPGIKIGISREQSKKYLRNRASCQIAARASSFYAPTSGVAVRRCPNRPLAHRGMRWVRSVGDCCAAVWRRGTEGEEMRTEGGDSLADGHEGAFGASHWCLTGRHAGVTRGAHWRHKGRDLGGGAGQEKCFFETTGKISPHFYDSCPGSGLGGVFSHLGRARCPAGRIKNQL